MSELVSVQPAKPGDGDPRYSGLSGVYYHDEIHPETKIFFAVTLRVVIAANGEPIYGTMNHAYAIMQEYCDAHAAGQIEIDPLCFWRDPADQRPPAENRKPYGSSESSSAADQGRSSDKPMYINKGYKIKRMVDEEKVYYEIAFKMSNGKESQHPAKIFNENYLKMLAKALAEAGYKCSEWPSGKAHMINIEFGVTKSDKVGPNGKAYNNYEFFKVVE